MHYFFNTGIAKPWHIKLIGSDTEFTVQIFIDSAYAVGCGHEIREPYYVPGQTLDPALEGFIVHPCPERTFYIDNLWQRNEWKDASVWSVLFGFYDRSPKICFNKTAEGLPARRCAHGTAMLYNRYLPVEFVVPFAEATFADATFFVHKHPDMKLITNLEFTDGGTDEEGVDALRKQTLPGLVITGPATIAPDQTISLTMSATLGGAPFEYPLDVELENVNGYLPKNRLRLDGTGTFKVSAMGLDPGDHIKIKAGFRYWASVAEKILEVV